MPKVRQTNYQPPKEVIPEHKEFMLKIGNGLLALRKHRGQSVSSLCREIGISRNAYAMMEKGATYFNLANLLKILQYFNYPPEVFFKDL